MAKGANEYARDDFLKSLAGIDTGTNPTIHLNDSTTEASDGDGATWLSNNATYSTTVPSTSWEVVQGPDTTSSKLQNSAEIDLGTPSGFTVEEVILQSGDNPDQFVTLENPTDSQGNSLDLSGSGSTYIKAGNLQYTFDA